MSDTVTSIIFYTICIAALLLVACWYPLRTWWNHWFGTPDNIYVRVVQTEMPHNVPSQQCDMCGKNKATTQYALLINGHRGAHTFHRFGLCADCRTSHLADLVLLIYDIAIVVAKACDKKANILSMMKLPDSRK